MPGKSDSTGCGVAILGGFLILPVVLVFASSYVIETRFERDCSGWLKMAADANSIPIARERLGVALKYIEGHGLTSGSTGVFWDKPTYALAPWYENLKEADRNLREFPENPTEADTSTALVKLRETLLDHGPHGDNVTVPSGAAFHPNNTTWTVRWGLTVALAVLGLLAMTLGLGTSNIK